MAGDFGSPVADPKGFSAVDLYGKILGIKKAQIGIQQAQSELQQTQQTTGQRAGIANWMSTFDPTKHVGPDGTLDLNSVLTDPKLRQSAGDQFPDLIGKMIGIKQNQLTAKQQLVNLNDDVRTQFSNIVAGLRTDPDVLADNPTGRQKAQQAIGQFSATSPDAARTAQIYGSVLNHVPQGKLSQTLSNFQLQAMDAATQASKQAPEFTNTGAALQQTNPQAAGGNLATQGNIPLKVGPGVSTFQDPSGNVRYFNQQNPGSAPLVGQGGGGAGGQGQGSNAPPVNVPGQQDVSASIDAARAADAQVGVNRDINRRILALNKETSAGPGTDFVHKVAAAVGLPSGASYQELGAFLDRQAASASQGMGLPATNQGLETAKQFTGNTQYNNKVIADKTKFVDALQTGTAAYRAGMERTLGNPNNPNYGGYQQFRAKWAQNFDPEVFSYENAVKSGDKEEQNKIERDLGRRGMAELRQKRKALMSLVNG